MRLEIRFVFDSCAETGECSVSREGGELLRVDQTHRQPHQSISRFGAGGVWLRLTAPGPFIAGNATFPAGTYTIRQEQDDVLVWNIFNDSKGYDTFLLTDPMDGTATNQKSEVTFRKYGNMLVLKQIWISGLETGYIVEPSYAEKKAAKAGKPTKVAVPAQKK